MKQFHLVLFFLCFSLSIKAQIAPKTKTIDFFSSFNQDYQKYSQENITTKYASSNFVLSPSLGYFINKNWRVSGGISLGTGLGSSFFSDKSSTRTSSSTYFGLGANVSTRYYLKNEGNKGMFAFLSGSYFGDIVNNEKNNNIQTDRTLASYWDWRIGMGAHKFIEANIAAEGILYYSNNNHNKSLKMGIYLNNFFQSIDKKDQETPQYIAKNRLLINGSVTSDYSFTNKSASLGLYGLYGKFLTDRLMLGGTFSTGVTSAKTTTNGQSSVSTVGSIYLGAFTRYYIALSPRLFIYPYVAANFNSNSIGSDFNTDYGLGYAYFLTKNIAISGTGRLKPKFSSSDNPETKSFSNSAFINCGLAYYIK